MHIAYEHDAYAVVALARIYVVLCYLDDEVRAVNIDAYIYKNKHKQRRRYRAKSKPFRAYHALFRASFLHRRAFINLLSASSHGGSL